MASEPGEFSELVEYLLDNGASPSIKCRMGNDNEVFTPFKLAQLHDAGDPILGLLSRRLALIADKIDMENGPFQKYNVQDYFCNVCLSVS